MTVKLICSQSLYYRDLVLKQLVDVHVAQEVTFPILDSLADALPQEEMVRQERQNLGSSRTLKPCFFCKE
jgi:hypothetical protein